MRFDEFIGNAKVIERLRQKLRERRFPHALIFAGPEGIGKRTCALLFAKALNCPEKGPEDFCDACNQCRKIDAGIHPDVLSIGIEEEASDIRIAQIRDLLKTLSFRPLEGTHKVFIIDGKIVAFGSYNFSQSAEERNDENVLIVYNEAIAGEFLKEFERVWELAQRD